MMVKDLFYVLVGMTLTFAEDIDELLVRITGDLVDIEPICELD